MKSPFPGMDPYLESHWGDVHSSLVLYSRDEIQQYLPRDLVARVEERLVVEPEEGDDRCIYPDVRVLEYATTGATASATLSTFTEPVLIDYSEPATETFLQILEPNARNRLITVVEFLSRSNKFAGQSQTQYRQKQSELRDSKVSLVEIDLLRAGRRVFSLPAARVPRKYRTTYQACVHRGWRATPCELYPIHLRSRLPILRIPLRSRDKDIPLDLQSVVEQAYSRGAYGKTIDYHEPAAPPLNAEDEAWADELLRGAGKRS